MQKQIKNMENKDVAQKMDRKIEKKKGWKAILSKKNWPWLAGVLFVGVLFLSLVAWLVFRDNSSTLRVDSRLVTIGKAESGKFNDYIRVSGQVLPITTVQLSPLEGGIVEERIVEEGATVRRGDVIVVLSNNQLNLQILDSEAQLAEKQNFLRNTMIAMEQDKLNLQQEKAQLDLDVRRKMRKHIQDEELFREKLISREEWLSSKEDYELSVTRRDLIMERQKQDSIYRTVQITGGQPRQYAAQHDSDPPED